MIKRNEGTGSDTDIRTKQRPVDSIVVLAADRLARLDPWLDAIDDATVGIDVEAFDWNCPQHITQRYTLAEVKEAVAIDPDLLRSCCPDPN